MIKQDKIKLIAKFFSKIRNEDDTDLDRLFSLQDQWDTVYNDNRIKTSFQTAQLMADEHILTLILSDDYE
jgi:hypothetical protein